MCTYPCAHEQKWSRTHTFHSYDQISFVRFLPPCPAPSAFQNSLTPSNDPGLPALTPTFLLLLEHTKSNISDNPFKSIYKYDMWQEKGCNSMRFSLYDNRFRCFVTDKTWNHKAYWDYWIMNELKTKLNTILRLSISRSLHLDLNVFGISKITLHCWFNFFFQWGMVLASLLSDIFCKRMSSKSWQVWQTFERKNLHALECTCTWHFPSIFSIL